MSIIVITKVSKMAKKIAKKRATKNRKKREIFSLSSVEERELKIDFETIEKLKKYLASNGRFGSELTISDLVTQLLLEKGQDGFKFDRRESLVVEQKLVMPKAAWEIAEKSAERSNAENLSEVFDELVKEL